MGASLRSPTTRGATVGTSQSWIWAGCVGGVKRSNNLAFPKSRLVRPTRTRRVRPVTREPANFGKLSSLSDCCWLWPFLGYQILFGVYQKQEGYRSDYIMAMQESNHGNEPDHGTESSHFINRDPNYPAWSVYSGTKVWGRDLIEYLKPMHCCCCTKGISSTLRLQADWYLPRPGETCLWPDSFSGSGSGCHVIIHGDAWWKWGPGICKFDRGIQLSPPGPEFGNPRFMERFGSKTPAVTVSNMWKTLTWFESGCINSWFRNNLCINWEMKAFYRLLSKLQKKKKGSGIKTRFSGMKSRLLPVENPSFGNF